MSVKPSVKKSVCAALHAVPAADAAGLHASMVWKLTRSGRAAKPKAELKTEHAGDTPSLIQHSTAELTVERDEPKVKSQALGLHWHSGGTEAEASTWCCSSQVVKRLLRGDHATS